MASDSILLVAYHDDCRFKIEENEEEKEAAGFYVFRFERDSTCSTHDYLQDSLALPQQRNLRSKNGAFPALLGIPRVRKRHNKRLHADEGQGRVAIDRCFVS
ncbi:hypothetical protein CRI93_14935 [Longimonas halophila]|uniref:Uncharacterized protein n=1 Tax=Longimonas halophila TaxID=1469170 RepID=A0A2H3P1H1_9BACT|nr:hypothetical protein [Longimonas halophila]PEN04561.1 hypothetical protein CRI93_14935 [Longimonas halophila]